MLISFFEGYFRPIRIANILNEILKSTKHSLRQSAIISFALRKTNCISGVKLWKRKLLLLAFEQIDTLTKQDRKRKQELSWINETGNELYVTVCPEKNGVICIQRWRRRPKEEEDWEEFRTGGTERGNRTHCAVIQFRWWFCKVYCNFGEHTQSWHGRFLASKNAIVAIILPATGHCCFYFSKSSQGPMLGCLASRGGP